MAENTKIEWCNHTVNLWWGCSKVHTGCKNCYAESLAKRYGDSVWGVDRNRKLIKSSFPTLDKIQKRAKNKGIKETVFIGSMMDIFELNFHLQNPDIPKYTETIELRNRLFRKIQNKEYENIVFLLLTKRPENIEYSIYPHWKINPPHNVWIGTSISDNQTKSYARELTKQWKGKKFLSIEPQIDMIHTLTSKEHSSFDWVIQGCESGRFRRPFKIEWAYQMKKECKRLGIPYFLKQIQDEKGNVIKDISKFPKELQLREFPVW